MAWDQSCRSLLRPQCWRNFVLLIDSWALMSYMARFSCADWGM